MDGQFRKGGEAPEITPCTYPYQLTLLLLENFSCEMLE